MKLESNRKIKSIVITPNHIMGIISSLNSSYQLNIFLLLLENLKDFSQKEFNNHLAGQKALFEQEVLTMKISLSDIAKSSEYREVKTAFLNMSKIICEVRYTEESIEKIWSGSLFSVSVPLKANYSSNITVNMDVVVARLFINFNRNNYRQPSFYSIIDTNIRIHTKFKNIVKLYLYLSLWKNKPFIKISLTELCNTLGVSKSYSIPANFKQHILVPSYQVLKDFNDVWFDLDKVKISKAPNKGHIIELQVINNKTAQMEQKRATQILDLLTDHFSFTLNDLNEMDDIIKSVPKDQLIEKLSDLYPYAIKVKHKVNYQ